jgi:hypothetical protein
MHRTIKALILVTALQLLCACSSTSVAQTTNAAQYKILILRISTNGQSHQVLEAKIVDSPIPLTTGESGSDTLNYVVTDSNGVELTQGGVDDPTILRSPLAPPGEPQQGHKTIVLPNTEYLLRLPYRSTMKDLYLVKGNMSVSATAKGTDKVKALTPSATVSSIDLSQWLPSAKD